MAISGNLVSFIVLFLVGYWVYGEGDPTWSGTPDYILIPLTPVLLFIRWRRGAGTECPIPAAWGAFRETLKRPASGGVIALGLVMAGEFSNLWKFGGTVSFEVGVLP